MTPREQDHFVALCKRILATRDNSDPERDIFQGKSQREQHALPNGKGCDIGYALAVYSRERAYSVDARTVAALEAITAFAVPNPNGSLAGVVGFFGSGCPSGCPVKQITQPSSD